MESPGSPFNKGDLVNLLQGGDAEFRFVDGGFAQERHSLFARQALDFGGGTAIENQLADSFAQVEQFVDGSTAAEARAATLEASGSFVKRYAAPLFRIESALEQILVRIADLFLAMDAD